MQKLCKIIVLCLTAMSFLSFNCAISRTENRWSPTENSLFEGDIMLRKGMSPEDRSAMTNREARWPNGIVYYVLDPTYSEEDIAILLSAMEEFKTQTCIEWVERTDEENYVEIDNDMGCWSELGVEGGRQTLCLESPLCMSKGVAMHEMMHTLGFLHEMSRSDRDDYVDIHWGNIIPGMEANFEKMSTLELDDLGLEYDYRSLMHYKAWAFAKDRSQPTCRPKNSKIALRELGHGQSAGEFTDLDLQKIKLFYEC